LPNERRFSASLFARDQHINRMLPGDVLDLVKKTQRFTVDVIKGVLARNENGGLTNTIDFFHALSRHNSPLAPEDSSCRSDEWRRLVSRLELPAKLAALSHGKSGQWDISKIKL
jgi:hypothetical protein